jgi:TolB-like protein
MERLLRTAQARKLDRIALAYAIAGWILVQGASIVLPAFDAPAWTMRAFILAVVIGFPATLAIAWFAVPHDETLESAEVNVSHREVVLLALLAVVLLLSLGELVFVLRRAPPSPAPMAAAGPVQGSIAVLPFVNMSGDPGKEIVSDGISEELLDDLSNIPALRVAARTSSFAFKGKNEDIKKIAGVLSVRTLLEGSVREDDKHIRIAAQLINAADGYQLWSATYDREMTGILTLEDEIARAITSALTNKLLGASAFAGKPASMDPVAYRKYLEGQHEFGPRTAEGVRKAVELFKQVTVLQPDFADGFAALGRAFINDAEYNPDQKDLMPGAEAALGRALALDPDNVNALSAHLDLALHRQDWQTAGADARRMKAINANGYAVLHEMFRYYLFLGLPDRALEAAKGAAQLDPLSAVDRSNVAAALIHTARFGEAASAAEAALAHADRPYIRAQMCTAYAHTNRLAQAQAIARNFAASNDKTSQAGCLFDIAVGSGHLADAQKIVDSLAAQYPNIGMTAADLGDCYAVAGDNRNAVTWLQRAYDQKDFLLFTIPSDKTIPQAFFASGDWKGLVRQPLFRDWQAAHDSLVSELAHSR